MILMVCGTRRVRHKDLAASLAVELGWRVVDADEFRFQPQLVAGHGRIGTVKPTWIGALHQTMAFANDRRESLVVSCPPLTAAQQAALRGDLRPVRFVSLREREGEHVAGESDSEALPDLALDVDPHVTPEETLGTIRQTFGV